MSGLCATVSFVMPVIGTQPFREPTTNNTIKFDGLSFTTYQTNTGELIIKARTYGKGAASLPAPL